MLSILEYGSRIFNRNHGQLIAIDHMIKLKCGLTCIDTV